MEVLYKSTRSSQEPVSASVAILKGLTDDGGLFVPDHIPALDKGLKELAAMSYQEVAYEVMKLYLTDFTRKELTGCIARAYNEKFDTEVIAPLAEADGAYFLELFHGATIAFKDMALSILPHLLTTSAKKNHIKNEIVILTATSGDTGKAALAGFADVEGTRIVVFYPKNGVSPIQEKQMVTQRGDNTFVVGIHGNFDDAQTGVKKIFSDKALAAEMAERGFQFSSANSINIGRLVPQIVYYVYAYTRLLGEGRIEEGQKINVAVPTGNFGNILAAYYAREMGLPVQRLICASNSNRVLTDFINTGIYDRRREFFTTLSPSMDILVSSNLERLLYAFSGEDSKTLSKWMEQLASAGSYDVGETLCKKIKNLFYGGFCDDSATVGMIADTWRNHRYLCDTHTAVAVNVYGQYVRETSDSQTPTIIASTASPYKFVKDVLGALEPVNSGDEFLNIARLEELTGMAAPLQLRNLKDKPNRFHTVIPKARSAQYILETLGIGEE